MALFYCISYHLPRSILIESYQTGELKNNPSIYSELNEKTILLKKRMARIFENKQIPVQINQLGSMISVHFIVSYMLGDASLH